MIQWWDSIAKVSNLSFEDQLEKWFYKEPTYGQLLSGDAAMFANFQENVRCIYMDPVSGIAQVDCRTISPSKDLYFLFYSEERGRLVIWGGLAYKDLMTLRPPGVVRKNEDLLWQHDKKTRCRSLASKVPDDDGDTIVVGWSKRDLFILPIVTCVDANQQVTGELFDMALNRLEWYYDPNAPLFPNGPLEHAIFLICATLARVIPKRETALAYQVHRMDRERWLFDQRIAPFLGSEKAILSLLKHNASFWSRHFVCRVVAPDAEDEQAFVRVFPGCAGKIPEIWIEIPVWEAPSPAMIAEFPMHPGGLFHMPFHPLWVSTWIWEAHVLPEAQRNFTDGHPICADKVEGPFGAFFQEAVLYVDELRNRLLLLQTTASHQKLHHHSDVIPIADMEDLFSVAPPCVQHVAMKQRRFPLNMERFHLTRILMGAGVPMNTMMRLYDRLNTQYSRGQPQSLEKRYNVEASAKSLEDKDPVWCTALINSAIYRRGSEGMFCPMATQAGAPPPPPKSDLQAAGKFAFEVRCRCVAAMAPDRPSHWKPWATPEQAMREGMKKRKMLHHQKGSL